MARRTAPSSAPSYVPHPLQAQRRAVASHDEDQSAFSRFLANEIFAPEKLPGNVNMVVGLTMFLGGIFAVRSFGELMIPA
ncbi:hypothetical protein H0H93_015496 [Arthromyces matolae]|nr:hypothetical protein H0H93_015496 [Arthromyces matolae]